MTNTSKLTYVSGFCLIHQVYILNTEKWNTFHGHCITEDCKDMQYKSVNQTSNLPHSVQVCPHFTLNPFSENSRLLLTSQGASFITYYIYNCCTYIFLCTNINTVIITTVTRTSVIFGLWIRKENFKKPWYLLWAFKNPPVTNSEPPWNLNNLPAHNISHCITQNQPIYNVICTLLILKRILSI